MRLFRPLARLALTAALLAGAPAIAQNDSTGRGVAHKGTARANVAPKPFVQDFAPAPAIWKVADADTTIYLFGTIHLLSPTLNWQSPRLKAVIAEADELVVESSDADFARTEAALAKALAADLAVDRPPLLQRVPAAQRPALARAVAASGLPAAMFDRLPTWMAVFALSLGNLIEDGATDEAGADATLERLFIAANKPVTSVEDPMAVLTAIRALPDAVQLALLTSAAEAAGDRAGKHGDSKDADPGSLAEERAWARGEIDRLVEGLSEKELGPEFYAVLIRDRNHAWTGWLRQRLDKPGIVLFAVGAGHLVGVDSVQAMLASRGVTATRVD